MPGPFAGIPAPVGDIVDLMPRAVTGPLRRELSRAFPERPFTVRFWDGTTLPSTSENGGPSFTVAAPAAVAHALRAPGQLGVGRAYVSGALEIDDLEAVMRLLDTWRPPAPGPKERVRLALAAATAAGLHRPPPVPRSELQPKGDRHTQERDVRAVRHHYDVSNDFFALFLDESMTYSCAYFSNGADTLEKAQEEKLELVCTKLALKEGDRVLDVGCGWGSFALHAARRHGAHVTGITLSVNQAEHARRRVEEAGLADRIEIRIADYREMKGERFDAIASIGMVEHVGETAIDLYARRLAGLLEPRGRLLNHGIARMRHSDPPAGPFSERYVFPDAEPLHLSRILLALERAGFETHHVEGLRDHYAQTLKHWAQRLDDNIETAVRLAGEERVRVWRLYLRAARNGFLNDFTSVYQVRATLSR
jgi:cyclopropane-fatty-acyl-phospholipid synthase